MSWNCYNHGLPFLPGYTFRDVTSAFHRPQTLNYKNGYALAPRPTVGIGQAPLLSEELLRQEINALSLETPEITYGSFNECLVEEFIPAYVALDKKVLCYYAYFQENIPSSHDEYCVRPVVIYYFLEDDTMCVIEPKVQNSGIPQGKRIKRQRLPKNECGGHYQWKDLNVGMDLEVYGVKYHITHCDAFTKEFMESEGIALNDFEPMPVDPYTNRRKNPPAPFKTPAKVDTMLQFLTMDLKVLHFFALWDDTDSLFGEKRTVTVQYYLVDDTVEINEVYERNSGRFPFPVLLHRQKLPKKLKPNLETFPSCVLEVSAAEVEEYYSPTDFQVGQTVTLLGRRFLLYDCDAFTKDYYQKNYPTLEMKPLEVPKKIDLLKERKTEVPPCNGCGSPEDSLHNCLSFVPGPPIKDAIKVLENQPNVLHYSAKLDSRNPKDEGREFKVSYFLCDDTMSISEKNTRDFSIFCDKFPKKKRIQKPGSTVDQSEFYSPADLAIGATVEVCNHRFVLTDADHSVLKYLESIASQAPPQTLECVRSSVCRQQITSQLTKMVTM